MLYIHIPFCHRVCPYCSFYKHTPGNTPIGLFIDALVTEASARISEIDSPRTIYFGGGTPSMLSPGNLKKLFGSLCEIIDFSKVKEVSFEANPATFDIAKANLFRELGITRVSLGIQSFTPHVLRTLGREHTVEQATKAFYLLREAGIASVNIDLMFSIPGQSIADWEQTLLHTLELKPDHISAYNLTYEEDTAFFESLRRGEMQRDEDDDAEHFYLANELLTAGGYEHYETSNYAMPGHRSLHNQSYWAGENYVGLGPSAVSTIGNLRSSNVADTARYIGQIQSIGNAMSVCETLSLEDRNIEAIALGLRTTNGISLDLLNPSSLTRAHQLVTEELATIENGRFILIRQGRALVDPIAADLI